MREMMVWKKRDLVCCDWDGGLADSDEDGDFCQFIMHRRQVNLCLSHLVDFCLHQSKPRTFHSISIILWNSCPFNHHRRLPFFYSCALGTENSYTLLYLNFSVLIVLKVTLQVLSSKVISLLTEYHTNNKRGPEISC